MFTGYLQKDCFDPLLLIFLSKKESIDRKDFFIRTVKNPKERESERNERNAKKREFFVNSIQSLYDFVKSLGVLWESVESELSQSLCEGNDMAGILHEFPDVSSSLPIEPKGQWPLHYSTGSQHNI